MKNIKKLLALSLLLSVPSMQYAMEDDAGFQQLAASAANAENQAIDNAGNQVVDTVDKAIEKNWYSNWSYPAMPDLGLQAKLNAFNEGYVAPALEYGQRQLGSVRAGLESAGKSGWEYGPRQIGEFAQNNPEAATAAGVAAVILGAYVWHRYTHPESGTPEEQKDAIKIVEDFKAQYPDAMEKAQALVQAEVKE